MLEQLYCKPWDKNHVPHVREVEIYKRIWLLRHSDVNNIINFDDKYGVDIQNQFDGVNIYDEKQRQNDENIRAEIWSLKWLKVKQVGNRN